MVPNISVGRQAFRPPFQYCLLVSATVLPKLLHLYSHLTSLPPLLFLLYLPTFLALDFVNVVIFWLLAHIAIPGTRPRASAVLQVARGFLCLGILSCSSSQIAFYFETGGELKWAQGKNFAHDPAGIKILLSGSTSICLVAAFITLFSAITAQPLYNSTWGLICSGSLAFMGRAPHPWKIRKEIAPELQGERGLDSESITLQEEGLLESSTPEAEYAPFIEKQQSRTKLAQWLPRLKFIFPAFTTIILLIVRPKHFPFAHLSGTIPYTLLEIWTGRADGVCQGNLDPINSFPLADQISSQYWESPSGKYPGWMPTANAPSALNSSSIPLPAWLPRERMQGFSRWYGEKKGKHHGGEKHGSKKEKTHEKEQHYDHPNYDPAGDPLRISNLDQDVLQEIREALEKSKITIKHVVVISLESTRKDVFPLKYDSRLTEAIKKARYSAEDTGKVVKALSDLTINAELLTGEPSGFGTTGFSDASKALQKLPADKGGLNIVGAFTGSTSTFKSMLGSHCGVQPLPVDFTVEAHGHIYQPCIPSILQLFNHNKKTKEATSSPGDITSRPWKSIFVQSITDSFDHQEELNRNMGFEEVVVKTNLLDPEAKYPPTERESNYFGFPESQVKPYLRDIFQSAQSKNERLFLSHFTSSTHHPWNTPEAAGPTTDFLPRGAFGSEQSLNKYLNTVRYGDRWIGEIMDLIDEFGMSGETLVVMVGDHGMAFSQDKTSPSTFENGHISLLRVPLLFHHPLLPRIQLQINATSLSIIPTILDLLTTTSSLSAADTEIAENLIQQYEGQSLIRPFLAQKNGRQAWNIGILNAGGSALSVSSAAVPYRLILPICKNGKYRYTNTDTDPYELAPVEMVSLKALSKKLGGEEGKWILDAEKVGMWWVRELRRRWRFRGKSLQSDRSAEEMKGTGVMIHKHWWET